MAERYLVVGPSWVGDMTMAQVLLRALKQANPNAAIDMFAPAWALPIAERMPEVSGTLDAPFKHGQLALGLRRRIGRDLRGRYSRAFITPGSFKSALVPFFAQIPQRTGYLGEQRYGLLNDILPMRRERKRFTAERYFNMARSTQPMLQPKLRVDHENQQRLQTQFDLGTQVTVLVPGAEHGPAKQWPLTHYAKVGKALAERGAQVVVLGSNKDHADGAQLAQHIPGLKNLCGQTSLADVIDLLALSQRVICNDSGLMHVAAAVGTQVFAIYGSSGPQNTPPLTEHKHLFHQNLACSPCFAKTCRFGHYDCLTQIKAEEVLGAIDHD